MTTADWKLTGAIKRSDEVWSAVLPSPVIAGLGFRRSVGVVVSEPHVGKTLFLLDLAIAAAAGQPWLRWSFLAPIPSLVCAFDSPEWETCEQSRNLLAGRGFGPADVIPFHLFSRDSMRRKLSAARFDIMNHDHFELLVEQATGIGARVLGIDSLSKIHSLDENARVDMENVMERLDKLAAVTNSLVLVMHHSPVARREGRTAYAGRGSGVIAASADLELVLVKKRNGERVVDVLKSRGSDEADHRVVARLERVEVDGVPRAVRIVEAVPAAVPLPTEDAIILRALLDGPKDRNVLAKAVAAETKVDATRAYDIVNRRLRVMRADGRVHSPKRGEWAMVTVREEPNA